MIDDLFIAKFVSIFTDRSSLCLFAYPQTVAGLNITASKFRSIEFKSIGSTNALYLLYKVTSKVKD